MKKLLTTLAFVTSLYSNEVISDTGKLNLMLGSLNTNSTFYNAANISYEKGIYKISKDIEFGAYLSENIYINYNNTYGGGIFVQKYFEPIKTNFLFGTGINTSLADKKVSIKPSLFTSFDIFLYNAENTVVKKRRVNLNFKFEHISDYQNDIKSNNFFIGLKVEL